MKRWTVSSIAQTACMLCLPVILAGIFFTGSLPARAASVDLPYPVYLPMLMNNIPPTLVTPGEGGAGQGLNQKVTVTIPPGAVTALAYLSVLPGCEITPPPDVSDAGMCVKINLVDAASGQSIHTLAQPATITFNIAGLSSSFIALEDLAIYHNAQGTAWSALSDSQADVTAKLVRGTTTSFSAFGLFAPVSSTYTPGGVAVDAMGRLYWVDYINRAIYRSSPDGSEPKVYFSFPETQSSAQYNAGDIEIGADGVVYYTDGDYVWKLNPSLTQTKLYERDFSHDTGSGRGDHINGIDLDKQDGTLYVARKRMIVQIDAASGAEIRNLGALPSTFLKGSSSSEAQDVVIGADRRIYAISRDAPVGTVPFLLWGNMYVYTEGPPSAGWLEVAYGFAGPFALEASPDGSLYVSNTTGSAISVLSGEDEKAVTGFIKNVSTPRGVVYSQGRLLVGAYQQIASIPAGRRDPPQAGQTVSFLPVTGSLSGAGSLITVKITNPEPIPAHHSLSIGGTTIKRLVGISNGEYRYQLLAAPNWHHQSMGELAEWLTTRPGGIVLRVGPQVTNGPWFTSPGPGTWHAHDYTSATFHVARGEWLTWTSSIYQGTSLSDSVTSGSDLFPDWDSSQGEWLAYQFNQNGDFPITVTRNGVTYTSTVHVTNLGPGYQWMKYEVSAPEGAVLYNQGAQLVIPPGALPGTGTYTVTFGASGGPNPASEKFTASAMSHQYFAEYEPEPDHLNGAITMRMPYDPAMTTAGQIKLGFYEANLNDFIQLDTVRSEEFVELTFPAGSYEEIEMNAAPAASPSGPLKQHAFRPRGRLNAISSYLRWFVGMPNEQVHNEHFMVLYNTLDNVYEAYAQNVLDELEYAYQIFYNQGYTVPNQVVLVKITPGATTRDKPGFAPQPGDVTRWFNMYIYHQLSPQGIEAVTAHEFFHILQYTNMSTLGRSRSPAWWNDSTAMWAQTAVHPYNGDFRTSVEGGANFINTSMNDWSGLNGVEMYATGIFAYYLEATHQGAVLRIFQNLGLLTDFNEALEGEVNDLGNFYQDFAFDYLTQTSPFITGFNLIQSQEERTLNAPVNALLTQPIAPLAAGIMRVRYIPTGGAPPFSDYNGSVMRVETSCTNGRIYGLDSNRQDTHHNIIGSNEPNTGVLMEKMSNYTTSSPLYLLYINVGETETCTSPVYLESPTIFSISPNEVKIGQLTTVVISGQGFGPVQGTTNNGSILEWTATTIRLEVNPGATGSIYVRVTHANFATSEPFIIRAIE